MFRDVRSLIVGIVVRHVCISGQFNISARLIFLTDLHLLILRLLLLSSSGGGEGDCTSMPVKPVKTSVKEASQAGIWAGGSSGPDCGACAVGWSGSTGVITVPGGSWEWRMPSGGISGGGAAMVAGAWEGRTGTEKNSGREGGCSVGYSSTYLPSGMGTSKKCGPWSSWGPW